MSLKRRFGWAVGLLAVSVFAVNYTPAALAQDANGQQQGQRGGRGGGRGGFGGNGNNNGGGRGNRDPAEARLRMESRLKELLGASDQEWAVLQPKVEKLMDAQRLQMAGRGAGMAQLFRSDRGGGDRGGNNNNNRPDRPQRPEESSPVAVRTRELQDAIRDNASPDVLKAKLAALRDARTKARDQYAKAQQELRELLTLKQEATLIMLGMLE
jgi:hypothetical protein